jgi:ketosteroid isomerase-like protein
MTPLSADDRLALEATFTAYCAAIDRRESAAVAASYYTEDGMMDNTALGSPIVEGRPAVTAAINGMFASMAKLEHFLSNFLVTQTTGNAVQTQCYVQAYGQPNGGAEFGMRGIYRVAMTRIDNEWKIARLTFQHFA